MKEKQSTEGATRNVIEPDKEELLAGYDSEKRKLAGTAHYVDHKKLAKSWRIIVRNVSFKTTEEQLRALFEPFGTVWEVTLIKKSDWSHHSGFAFVQICNRDPKQQRLSKN